MLDKYQKICYNIINVWEVIMNNARRKQLKEWCDKATELKEELNNILLDEQNSYDNMPENLQGSIRGMNSEEAIDQIEDAINNLEDAIDIISEI